MSDASPILKVAHFRGSAEADAVEESLAALTGEPVKQRHITGAAGPNELLQILLPYAPGAAMFLLSKLAEKLFVDPLVEAAGETIKERAKLIVGKLKASPASLTQALTPASRELAKSRAAGNSTSIGIELDPTYGRNAVVQVTEDDPERLGLLLLLLAEYEDRIREIVGNRPHSPQIVLPAKYGSTLFDNETPDVSIGIRLDETAKRLYFPLRYCIDGDWSPKGQRALRYYVDNGEVREEATDWEFSV